MVETFARIWHTDLGRLAILVATCALLSSLELLIPLFRFRPKRLQRAFPNLALTAGVVVTNLAFASVMASVATVVTKQHFGLFNRMHFRPLTLLLLSVAGLDFFAYIAHLLLHKTVWGWKFHCVHHSEMEVDVTTAFRQHPGETVWRVGWQCVGIAFLGLPFWVVPIYLTLSGANALVEHANIRMSDRLDLWLRLLVVTPSMHKIHHSREARETDSNYSNIFSVWDRLCGTHTRSTDYRALRYGLEGFEESKRQGLLGLMTEPFRAS